MLTRIVRLLLEGLMETWLPEPGGRSTPLRELPCRYSLHDYGYDT